MCVLACLVLGIAKRKQAARTALACGHHYHQLAAAYQSEFRVVQYEPKILQLQCDIVLAHEAPGGILG
jgi:hypothetical protein